MRVKRQRCFKTISQSQGLDLEYENHHLTKTRRGYLQWLRSYDYMGQMLLTFRYETKDLYKIKRMLKVVNHHVTAKLYGRRRYERDNEKNGIKWVAVVERNTLDDGLHIHVLIITPNTEFIRDEYKNIRLNEVCSFIKEKWVSIGGGIKGNHRYFNDEEHLEETLNYLMKQYNKDTDHFLFDHAPKLPKKMIKLYK